MSDDEQTIDRDEPLARRLPTDPDRTATMSISGSSDIEIVDHITIGRDPQSLTGETIVIDADPLVSKSHLALRRESGGVVVTDLGSSNGTFLHYAGSETPVPTDRWIHVPSGAEIEFGDQRMTVVVAGNPTSGTADSAPFVAPAPPLAVLPDAEAGRWYDLSPAPPVVGPPPATVEPAASTGPSFTDPSATAPARSTTKILGVLAAVIAFAVGAVVLVRILADRDGAQTRGIDLPEAPATVEEQWSESVRGEVLSVHIGSSSVYVSSINSRGGYTLSSLDLDDGDEQWDAELDVGEPYYGELIAEYDDIAVFLSCGASCLAVGVERSTGDIAWERGSEDVLSAIDVDGRLFWVEGRSIARLDPSDGTRIERVRGDDVGIAGTNLLLRDDGEVEVFDADLELTFGPVEVDPDSTPVSYTGSQLVVAVDDELHFVDASGDVVVESRVDDVVIEEINFVDDDNLVLVTANGVMAVDPEDGEADVRWSEDADLLDVVTLGDGDDVVILRPAERDDAMVIDAGTGERRFRIDDYAVDDTVAVTIPTSSSLLIVTENFGESTVEVRALAWADGDELWTERFAGQVAVGSRALAGLTRDGDVALHR